MLKRKIDRVTSPEESKAKRARVDEFQDSLDAGELSDIDVDDIVPLPLLAKGNKEFQFLTSELEHQHPRFLEQVSERQKHVLSLAADLLKQHKLDGWTCVFDNSKTRAGMCDSKRKVIQLSALMVQKYFLEEGGIVNIRNTILHEIAHALTPPEFKQTTKGRVMVHHGPEWKAMAIKVGAKPERCHSMDFSGGHRYFLKCPSVSSDKFTKCGWSAGYNSKPKKWRHQECKYCKQSVVLETNKDFKGSGFVMRKSK